MKTLAQIIKFALLLTLLFTGTNNLSTASEYTHAQIGVPYFIHPPYFYDVDGQPDGLLHQILNTAFESFGVTVKYEVMPISKSSQVFQRGKLDSTFVFAKGRSEGGRQFEYFQVPLISVKAQYLSRSQERRRFENFANQFAFRELRIGIPRSSVNFGRALDRSNTIVKIDSPTELARQLLTKQVDVIAAADLFFDHHDIQFALASQLNLAQIATQQPLSLHSEGRYDLVMLFHRDDSRCKLLATALKQAKADGRLEKLYREKFPSLNTSFKTAFSLSREAKCTDR